MGCENGRESAESGSPAGPGCAEPVIGGPAVVSTGGGSALVGVLAAQ